MARSHVGCRTLYHIQNGLCYFCEKMIEPNEFGRIVIVHHINHDHYDNRLKNRALCHQGCHRKHHWFVKNCLNMIKT